MVFKSSRRKQVRKVSFKSNNTRCITVNSHFNSIETNYLKTSNSDNVIVNSNLPRINVHTKSSLDKIITFQEETDTDSGTNINDEIIYDKNTSE